MKTLEMFWMNIWKAKGVALLAYLLGRGGDNPLDSAGAFVQQLFVLAGAG